MTRAWHCSFLVAKGAKRTPCQQPATVFWHSKDKVKSGFCSGHSTLVRTEALMRGWTQDLAA